MQIGVDDIHQPVEGVTVAPMMCAQQHRDRITGLKRVVRRRHVYPGSAGRGGSAVLILPHLRVGLALGRRVGMAAVETDDAGDVAVDVRGDGGEMFDELDEVVFMRRGAASMAGDPNEL
jgi:hypothetical protein